MEENDLLNLIPQRIILPAEEFDWLEEKLAEEPKDLPKLRDLVERGLRWQEPCQ
jgi:DNA-directed RNA polymerase subunit H (RpoH/RPB5)